MEKDEQKETGEMLQYIIANMATKNDIAEIKAEMTTKDDLVNGLTKLERELRAEIRDSKEAIETTMSKETDFFSSRTMNHENRLVSIENQLGIQPNIPTFEAA